ncbi:uncharacterized protein Z520_03648 [Fonsecaea multimorphosa CBS 102226]|uniref:NADH:flavin oxidoreductase/NADH oxidase N-terminal domain-containing protein n=1 Tax=Fonsecaea multimorphosa CBS 102226 TaxID=1442371 RepID=A0A0D2IVA4_9EURO|nr:uncharacterized protein Z520_03648 [Fonsecaea multimorphosa CBS 102226]KIY00982.1 hypothetical protein Z520_03648 [Fonsecaea multimorphosa CBS 102226]OAL27567.1 hypothetical protein AYO22_03471 [Fonsecaea multimorphosa]
MALKLFTPLKLGNDQLKHRIAMSPLTRYRADDDHVPLPYVKEYYAQRASVPGTQIITEATFITPEAGLFAHIPGIWSGAQIAAWSEVTAAVHAKGSFIRLQLWALGRSASKAQLTKELGPNARVVSSSDVTQTGGDKPTPLTEEEIQQYIKSYAQAAKNAIKAGFDGVELHGASGYLIDQFTQDVTNKRTDKWGGSINNRSRFALEATKAVVEAIGSERTGIRLSPFSTFQGMRMKDPMQTFGYLVQELKKLKLGHLHLVTGSGMGDANQEIQDTASMDVLLNIYDNVSPILVANGFSAESAKEFVERHPDKDIVVAFGRYFISNPDLPFRIREGIEFTPYDRAKFYTIDEDGYTTYEFSKQFLEANQSQGPVKV